MRNAIAAAILTALLAVCALTATALLAGLDAAHAYAVPAPSANQEPRP